jgi:murein DD-endopeptidase MepM/ murein hydrolase activator NlpD
MKWANHRRARVVLGFLVILVAVAVLVARLSRVSRDGRQGVLTWSRSHPVTPIQPTPGPSPQSQDNAASVVSTPGSSTPNAASPAPLPEVAPGALIIPVAGVRPDQLHDTFSEARSEGRVHDAIDIPAPHGTPVLAAANGTIVKLFQSERGGTTIYQLSADNKFIYYYAHLDRYAEGLTEGQFVKQGGIIAYVGDTGNAGTGNYHLHFSIALVSDPKRYWEGVNINPYPLLKR